MKKLQSIIHILQVDLGTSEKKFSLAVVIALLLHLTSPALLINRVRAAGLTETSILLERMGAAVAANTSTARILVVIKPTTVGSIAKVRLTWPTTNAFTVSATDADHTVTTTGIPSTYQGEALSAPSSVTSPGAETSGAVTFAVTGMSSATTLYGFYVTGGITNPATGNAGTHNVTVETLTSGDAVIDSTSVAVDTTTTNADQVAVTATVGSSFNFALSSNSISLGALSSGAVTTGSVTVDIDSNAENGWVGFIRSEGVAKTLASASTGDSISSTDTSAVVTLAAGTEGYVVDVSAAQGGSSTGSLTEATEYAGNGTTSGGVIDTAYEQIAQSTGQALNDTLTLTAIVAISNLTQAATDYTDTWEVVGAGNF